MTRILLISSIFAGIMTLSGCQTMGHLQPAKASADIRNTTTQADMGGIKLRPMLSGVQVYGTITGLAPNSVHAIHIHQNPSCADKGEAAGGHFNPTGQPHSQPTAAASHSGDMPNITADSNGVAKVDLINSKITLTPNLPNSVYNHAIIVHAGADDYVSQPSGNAGGRIACGVIN